MKPQRTVRCRAERIGTSSRFRFTCPDGHVTEQDVNHGKPRHVHLSASGIDRLASWWSKDGNGVAFHCPQCFPRGRFSDQRLQEVYEVMLTNARDPASDMYHKGQPRRGASHRCAFWDGYDGRTLTGPTRSAHVIRGTLSHACWAAGQDFRKERRE